MWRSTDQSHVATSKHPQENPQYQHTPGVPGYLWENQYYTLEKPIHEVLSTCRILKTVIYPHPKHRCPMGLQLSNHQILNSYLVIIKFRQKHTLSATSVGVLAGATTSLVTSAWCKYFYFCCCRQCHYCCRLPLSVLIFNLFSFLIFAIISFHQKPSSTTPTERRIIKTPGQNAASLTGERASNIQAFACRFQTSPVSSNKECNNGSATAAATTTGAIYFVRSNGKIISNYRLCS